ncbi:putative methionine/alanine importer small subunit [Halopolyspora algeriensis]|uniref:Putative methionine/alanine importer small subunit n=1 Tax=Halopolyspora algeriensis TaxID=1500506 RepID=A0A368VQ23_9ACTN|nr:methionine/alanine import family NSS transporter small subunit [Halopolyspora algeriensis]RCW43125.1 putative methionine/alanine importer small subunit [Halopolyspora algeriensis]TQM56183.1 putative methionine/alanine importer small subunit [Halopolyspora algeriensis]
MSTAAILMMIIAIVLVWGGLLASAIHLRRHPEPREHDEPDQ